MRDFVFFQSVLYKVLVLPRVTPQKAPPESTDAPYTRHPRTLLSWEDSQGKTHLRSEILRPGPSIRGRGRGMARGVSGGDHLATDPTRGGRGKRGVRGRIPTMVISRTEDRVAANEQASATGTSQALYNEAAKGKAAVSSHSAGSVASRRPVSATVTSQTFPSETAPGQVSAKSSLS